MRSLTTPVALSCAIATDAKQKTSVPNSSQDLIVIPLGRDKRRLGQYAVENRFCHTRIADQTFASCSERLFAALVSNGILLVACKLRGLGRSRWCAWSTPSRVVRDGLAFDFWDRSPLVGRGDRSRSRVGEVAAIRRFELTLWTVLALCS